MYDDQTLFDVETKQMFIEIPDLEERLSKLKAVILKVTELCTNSDVKISFAVFEAFNVLS